MRWRVSAGDWLTRVMMKVAGPEMPGLWHAALFHRGAGQFEAAAAEFAAAAARADAAVLVACPDESLGGLRARLGGMAGEVSWADMASVGANPGRLISVISRFAAEHPGRPVWFVLQAAWPARPADELWEVLRHEALVNLALAGAAARVLCPYDAGLPGEVISCAEATHPVIGGSGGWQPSARYPGAAGGPVPAECERPLPPPPASARVVRYAGDLSRVRRLAWVHARSAGLAPGRAGDLEIAVGELAANTLAHGGGAGTLTLWRSDGAVICQVQDGGNITSPLAGRIRPGPAASGGGRGLWIVHQVCDLVQVRTGPAGTTIRVHMRRGS